MINVLLIGDCDENNVLAHRAIPKALELAAAGVSVRVKTSWINTASIHSAGDIRTQSPQAIWCVPGSPYANMEGALTAIRFARENRIPFLGTCGGFQHALIEYARNVLNISEADHEESNPGAKTPVIAKLSCALINKSERLNLRENSKLRAIYDSAEATEAYQCSYGVNPKFREVLANSDLAFSAFNADGEPRAFELRDNPFFVGTLFQPERSALAGEAQAHPLISAFLRAAD